MKSSKTKIYALLDCNNFFVSCERIFRPDLLRRPVMVLSSNDGCVVARSQEVKDLGIPMGIPFFKIKDMVKKHSVTVFSSNFSLYRDISRRVMGLVLEQAPEAEIYSIDEVFMDLTHVPNFEKFCHDLRAQILKYCGVPVSIGVASTKTLAKVANSIAKKHPDGFFDMTDSKICQETLHDRSVGDVWGIGRSSYETLRRAGVNTVPEFCAKPNWWIRKILGIGGVRKAEELRGFAASEVEETDEIQKSMISSRSFPHDVTSLTILKQAVSHHIAEVSRQLRDDGLAANFLSVSIRTNRHRQTPQNNQTASVRLENATSDNIELNRQAMILLDKIYEPGFKYKKAGVMVSNFEPENLRPDQDLFGASLRKNNRLMRAVDFLNDKYGDGTIYLAVEGTERGQNTWRPSSSMRSRAFTTNANEIAEVF